MSRLTNRVHRPRFVGMSPRARAEKRARVNASRDPIMARLYDSPEWKVLRRDCLRDAGNRCAVEGCRRRAVIADHKTPHGGEAYLFFDRGNLQALCKPHHDRKTARHDGGFGRALSPSVDRRTPRPNDLTECNVTINHRRRGPG
jgi:5-methylcytosine-specific restriction enzyme A